MITSIRSTLRDQFWQEYANKVKDLCFNFVKNHCSVDDLRNASKKDLTYFTNYIESMLDSLVTNNEERKEKVFYYSENLELEIALRCLQMPVLEKKLLGHATLINKIHQVKTQPK